MRYPGNVVTVADTRYPGSGRPDCCLYCKAAIGGPHEDDCVCIHRPVKVKMTVEVIISVPRSNDKHAIEFHLNDSSWCTDNILDVFARQSAAGHCLCLNSHFEYVGDATLEEAVDVGLIADSETDMVKGDDNE